MLLRLLLPAMLVAPTFFVGCTSHCCSNHAGSPGSAEFGLPQVQRSRIVGRVDLASFATEVDPPPAVPREYVGLSAIECQCLAAEHSAIGNLLDRERWATCLHEMSPSERRARCLQLSVLRAASQEARNRSAADALKLYYGLAEVEAGLDAVEDSLALVNQATADIAQLRKQELTVPFDASEFERRRLALESKRAELHATRAKLNAQLRTLLGFEQMPDAALLFPTEPLEATAEPLDAETEVAHGLATRGELQVLRLLANADPATSTDTIRSLLGGINGLAGMAARTAAKKFALSMLCDHDPEPCTRHNQVAALYRNRSTQLSGEIRAAVEAVFARRRQAALAQESADSWHRRVRELADRRESGGSSFAELAEARLREVEARAAVTTAVIELKRAEVELRELEGALAAECAGTAGLRTTITQWHEAPAAETDSAAPPEPPQVEPLPKATIRHPQPPRPQREGASIQSQPLPHDDDELVDGAPLPPLKRGPLFAAPPVGSPILFRP